MRGLRLARQDALEEIFALYAARVRWMNEVGIHQWNDTDYLGCIRRTTMRICSGAGFFLCSRVKTVRDFARGAEACKLAQHGEHAARLRGR